MQSVLEQYVRGVSTTCVDAWPSSDHDNRHPSFVHALHASMCRHNALWARSLVNYMLPLPSLDTDVGVTGLLSHPMEAQESVGRSVNWFQDAHPTR